MTPDQLAHYRILRHLGGGGMGQVYLAEDLRLARKVALKVLRPEVAEGGAGRKRFLREAQAISQLDHPNVCTIYEVGECEGTTFIAMQYIEGQDLAERMQAQPLDPPEWLNLGIQVLEALAEAHARGIIHRDIKPQNILITPKGTAKVLDFGLAKRVAAPQLDSEGSILTAPGMVIGTVPYMSPEQVRGEDLDGRSDLFSLGVVLFELATGRRPFESASGVELMALILTHDPFARPEMVEGLPLAIQHVLKRAMAKNPAHRYPSAQAMEEDLQRLLDHPHAAQEGPVPSGRRPASGSRWLPTLTSRPRWLGWGAAILALAAVGSLAAVRWGSPEVESIAILPISNESGDPGLDYVGDGLTENLIAQLSTLPRLKVIARASILRYKGLPPDPGKVGHDLGVQTVLVGRMRLEQGQIKLTFELADARDHRRLWGSQLLRPPSDLLTLQEILADQVAANLGRSRRGEGGSPSGNHLQTTSGQAYDLYLRGRFHADRWLPAEVDRAIAYFDQALALDPGFALPHVGKANAYWGLAGSFQPSFKVLPKAKAEAEAALKLDPLQPEALSIRALATMACDRDFASADQDFKTALRLAPNHPAVLQAYGYALMGQGHSREGIRYLDKAISLDPLSPIAWTFLSFAQQTAGDLPASTRSAQRVIALDPEFYYGHLLLGLNLHYQGKQAEAIRALERAAASESPQTLAILGKVLAQNGRHREARAILERLNSSQARSTGLVSPVHLALVHAGLGEFKTALDQLARAADLREEEVIGVPTLRHWQEVRRAPGYAAFLRKLDLKGFFPESPN